MLFAMKRVMRKRGKRPTTFKGTIQSNPDPLVLMGKSNKRLARLLLTLMGQKWLSFGWIGPFVLFLQESTVGSREHSLIDNGPGAKIA